MSFLGGSGPKPVDPTASSNAQLGFNQQAAEAQQQINMINQQTPFASLDWMADPNAPGGYKANYQLTPEQQQILSATQQLQLQAGGAGQQLGSQLGSLYGGAPPNFADPNAVTSQLMKWQQAYVQPIFGQQQSNLDAQLYNQGLSVGDKAYQNAQNLLARNQGDVNTNFLMQAQPLGFQEMMQSYMNPLSVYGSLQKMAGGPAAPGWVTAPQETIAPPNYQQAAQAQWEAQQKQYQQQQQGIGQLLGAAASIGLAPFTGGASLMALPGTLSGGGGGGGGGGGMGSLFSGGWGGSGYGGVTPQFGLTA